MIWGALAAMLFVVSTPLHAAQWSGRIRVETRVTVPAAKADKLAELNALVSELDKRIAFVKKDLPAAGRARRKVLLQDLASFKAERNQAKQQRGGDVLLADMHATVLDAPAGIGAVSSSCRLLVVDEDRAILVDHSTAKAVLRSDSGQTEVTVLAAPKPRAASKKPGPSMFGHVTELHEVSVAGKRYEVAVAPGLPNVYALAGLKGHQAALPAVLSQLPGMPLRLRRLDDPFKWRQEVVALQAGGVPATLSLP